MVEEEVMVPKMFKSSLGSSWREVQDYFQAYNDRVKTILREGWFRMQTEFQDTWVNKGGEARSREKYSKVKQKVIDGNGVFYKAIRGTNTDADVLKRKLDRLDEVRDSIQKKDRRRRAIEIATDGDLVEAAIVDLRLECLAASTISHTRRKWRST